MITTDSHQDPHPIASAFPSTSVKNKMIMKRVSPFSLLFTLSAMTSSFLSLVRAEEYYYYGIEAQANITEEGAAKLEGDIETFMEIFVEHAPSSIGAVFPGEEFDDDVEGRRQRRNLMLRGKVRAISFEDTIGEDNDHINHRGLAIRQCPRNCRRRRRWQFCVRMGCCHPPYPLKLGRRTRQRLLASDEPLSKEDVAAIIEAMQEQVEVGGYCDGIPDCDVGIEIHPLEEDY